MFTSTFLRSLELLLSAIFAFFTRSAWTSFNYEGHEGHETHETHETHEEQLQTSHHRLRYCYRWKHLYLLLLLLLLLLPEQVLARIEVRLYQKVDVSRGGCLTAPSEWIDMVHIEAGRTSASDNLRESSHKPKKPRE